MSIFVCIDVNTEPNEVFGHTKCSVNSSNQNERQKMKNSNRNTKTKKKTHLANVQIEIYQRLSSNRIGRTKRSASFI